MTTPAGPTPRRAWRLALAQVNPTVGDLGGNAALVVETTRRAVEAGASVVAFPEMVLTGYPIEDLALRSSFQLATRTCLQDLAGELVDAGLGEIAVVVGLLDAMEPAPERLGRPHGGPLNAAAVLRGGQVIARYAKQHLPNYGVFDEARYFVPGTATCVFDVDGLRVGLLICEDLWQDGPITAVRDAGAQLVIVINGSPYERDKDETRLALCARRAREVALPLAYVNMYGGQDELVFDGGSLVVASNGELVGRAREFEPDVLFVDVDESGVSKSSCAQLLEDDAEVWAALCLGLRDYVHKNGFRSAILGVSGGIDSALVGALAVDAIGAANVHGISQPSAYSSEHSKSDAADLAARTGLQLRVVPIAGMVDAFQEQLHLTGVAEENLQARVRGMTWMGISNQEGHLVLATGNKSEVAVGYSTIYGDAVGAYAPIKDVLKTDVWRLARWRNAEALRRGETPPIPDASITKPPSAELRPGQLDSDSLPTYEVLDDILRAYVEHDRDASQLIADGADAAIVIDVIAKVDRAEYKRRQYPPGTKISARNFGRDRRLPMTNRWRDVSGN